MPRRDLLTEQQRFVFSAPPTDERAMVRYYTLGADDMALIDRRRGDHNRLGFAMLLCYLRFPGRVLQENEQPPPALLRFVAEQLSLNPATFGGYAQRDPTRRAHLTEIQVCQNYRPFGRTLYREFATWLLPTAFNMEKGLALVAILLDELRAQHVICPPLPVVERLCSKGASTSATASVPKAYRRTFRISKPISCGESNSHYSTTTGTSPIPRAK